jgi:hypothetical protein
MLLLTERFDNNQNQLTSLRQLAVQGGLPALFAAFQHPVATSAATTYFPLGRLPLMGFPQYNGCTGHTERPMIKGKKVRKAL